MASTEIRHRLLDRFVGFGPAGNMVGNGLELTRPCVDATITIGAEAADVRAITLQFKDVTGANIDYVEMFDLIVFSSAAMTAFATTGGSTGVAIGASGAALAVVAKKLFLCTSTATGGWAGTWTDIGTESVAVGVRLPNGRVVVSAAFANV